jgi:hypothetical protein
MALIKLGTHDCHPYLEEGRGIDINIKFLL